MAGIWRAPNLWRDSSIYAATKQRRPCTTACQPSSNNEHLEKQVSKVVIVGSPNAGKSTLSNRLLGEKRFPVSPKVHTTRHRSLGAFVRGGIQVVLLDTPGIVDYKYARKLKMSRELMTDPEHAIAEADLALLMVDASHRKVHSVPPEVLRTIYKHRHIPFALVLNKVDLVRHKHLLLRATEEVCRAVAAHLAAKAEPTEDAAAKSFFKEVFMVSSLTGDGLESLQAYLLRSARPGSWLDCRYTSQGAVLTVVEDIVREKLFLHLDKEIPYVIKQSNVLWEESEDGLAVLQNLTCKSNNQKSIVIGPGGSTIQKITEQAAEDIEQIIGKHIELTLNVRSAK